MISPHYLTTEPWDLPRYSRAEASMIPTSRPNNPDKITLYYRLGGATSSAAAGVTIGMPFRTRNVRLRAALGLPVIDHPQRRSYRAYTR
jgi:hypothetical protein